MDFYAKTVNFLDLSKNELQGSFPQWLAEIKVEYMILSDNKLSGSLPPALFQSSRLFVLALSRNNFSGELPYNIGDAKTLYILMKQVFWGLALNLTKLRNLQRLELQDNYISGELPNFLFHISHLQVLILRNNSLQGLIPKTISNLKYLQILDLSSNNLTGEIPIGFVNLAGMIEAPHLTSISNDVILVFHELISSNIMVNVLIVNWKKSKQGLPSHNIDMYFLLGLSNNQLSGEIPASLGGLKALRCSTSPITNSLAKYQQAQVIYKI
ncbi:LRR receptor-like serine/threonine-protein kinase GSO1 [Vitis vinifera]|uniref:LRR receptor-like serine/threonine-protein kinase GSO1 n=1 Tax=Vitis vinifera TaxID=29760 RepID=A0A438JVT3_VITVI|nr:LRR receptor-like serine/threonine-protein kinase GSO1 [Vitis vinifera]